jgi:predicted membrane-bound mannosyltransferase
VLKFRAEVERALAARAGPVRVIGAEYWPLPWYLRNYPKAAFWGTVMSDETDLLETPEALVLSNVTQQADVQARIGDSHELIGTYTLRPGVELELYLRSDLVAATP